MSTQTEHNPTLSEITKIDDDIAALVSHRNSLLRQFRLNCKHLQVLELDGAPPRRICIECGAEEEGWYCGYQILDNRRTLNLEGRIVEQAGNPDEFYSFRKKWPLYFVGQSHENFPGGGTKTYKELTEIPG